MTKVMYAYPNNMLRAQVARLKQRVAELEKRLAPERVVSIAVARKEMREERKRMKGRGVTSTDVFEMHDALNLPYEQVSRLLAEFERKGIIKESKDI